MIKDCVSPYDGRHEGAARLGQTGTSPVAFHNTTRDVALCPASEQRPGRVFAEIKGRKCGHIERTRATAGRPRSLTFGGQRYRWARAPARRAWFAGAWFADRVGGRTGLLRREPGSCAVWGFDFQPKASSCPVVGAIRPEQHTMTSISGLLGMRGDREDVVVDAQGGVGHLRDEAHAGVADRRRPP